MQSADHQVLMFLFAELVYVSVVVSVKCTRRGCGWMGSGTTRETGPLVLLCDVDVVPRRLINMRDIQELVPYLFVQKRNDKHR